MLTFLNRPRVFRMAGPWPVARRLSARHDGEPPTSRAQAGWTMIELLIVISIIMILSAIALTSWRNSVTLAKEAVLRSDLMMMREAIDQYYADKGKYPDSLQSLVSESYLRALPKDPFTNSTDSWQTEEAEPQPGSNTAEPGVFDVKSGASGTATDGSNFSDW
jgi:general secretion pathway protein G